MTVTYSLSVSNTKVCGFAKLLFRWKGSIYKLMFGELLIFCVLYYSLGFLYRYGLSENNKLIFVEICTYCQSFTKYIPLSFVLGFYVTIVVTRWWDQYKSIPWPDRAMMVISGHLQGTDDRSRMMRRTIARYLVLLLALTLQAISSSVKKRFPTIDHIQEAGLLTNAERIAYDKIPDTHGRWWVPAQWCSCILVRARKEKRIKHDILLRQCLDELYDFRGNCGMLWSFDWISIPLVYTQTVTIATYIYFIAAIMARQSIDTKDSTVHTIDSYVPIFTIMEFLCYMGWLKVAEQLINPFGLDDDDFECNYRNLFIGLYFADEMHNQFPILVKDSFWEEEEPTLPYTKSSLNLRSKAHLGSAANLYISDQDAEFVPLEPIMEDDKDDYVLNDLNDSVTPDVTGYRFNYNLNKPDLDGVSVSTTGLRIPVNVPGSKFFNMLLGQSNENVNKNINDRYLYYNEKKNSQQDEQNNQASSQASTFLQMPIRFPSFINRNKKTNVTRSNTTSTNNSMTRLGKIRQRKQSIGANSAGMKNATSSTAISRISNDDLNSLQSEALSFANYKSSPIAYRKYSFRGHGPIGSTTDDQQSLINFEKFPEIAQLNQINSMSSSADSSQNQPIFAAYLQGNPNQANSRFSVLKSHQSSPQPHQLVSQLNHKLAQLERTNHQFNQYPLNYPPVSNYPSSGYQMTNNQADDTESTVSTISGLQMNILPNTTLVERSNSRISETKVTIEDDKQTPIFNINNTDTLLTKPIELNSLVVKETSGLPPIPLANPLNAKTLDNDSDKNNKETNLEHCKDTKELVTIVEEKIEPSNDQSNMNQNTISIESADEKKEETKKLGKKLSVDSIYEPNFTNSSQESLSPFQSNQNTVTSFADWIKKAEEDKD